MRRASARTFSWTSDSESGNSRMLQLSTLAMVQTAGDAGAFELVSKLLPEGVSVAAVIAVVILFLRRQKESQDNFQEQLRQMQTMDLERDKLFVMSMDRLTDKIDRLGTGMATARAG